jgi:hypothetical protein
MRHMPVLSVSLDRNESVLVRMLHVKTPDKIQAITNAPKPENVTQLKSFLGLMNYYGKCLPDLATVLNPLHHLLHKGQQWKWNQSCNTIS